MLEDLMRMRYFMIKYGVFGCPMGFSNRSNFNMYLHLN